MKSGDTFYCYSFRTRKKYKAENRKNTTSVDKKNVYIQNKQLTYNIQSNLQVFNYRFPMESNDDIRLQSRFIYTTITEIGATMTLFIVYLCGWSNC